MTITGDAAGNSEGMAWLPGQLYGRWEVCMQTPVGSANYHPVALLWPDTEIWPGDGEIDFAEIVDPARRVVTASVHYRADGDPPEVFDPKFNARVAIDATQWHSWAVEWAPDRVVGYVDGVQWFEVTGRSPRVPMHLCLQLDNFGGDISQGGRQSVDWARQYPL